MQVEIPESITFNGVTYKLMGGKRKYYLSQQRDNKKRKGAKGLHVAVWEFYNKRSISKGRDIHHKDHNSFNNDISNLECLSIREHRSMHIKERIKNNPKLFKSYLDKARIEASKWHGSPAGKKWHREKSKKQWANPEKFECICKRCSKKFSSFHRTSIFCSDACVAAARRASGVDNTQRNCNKCGQSFTTNRYSKAKTCPIHSRKARSRV